MRTLCDTNILIDLYGRDQIWHDWSRDQAILHRRDGPLVVNPIIYAEFSVGYGSVDEIDAVLADGPFEREALPWASGFLAGAAFLTYRRQGGDKRSPLPDFYIGAHASVRGYRLLTRDAGRYRAYFPTLDLISPETHP